MRKTGGDAVTHRRLARVGGTLMAVVGAVFLWASVGGAPSAASSGAADSPPVEADSLLEEAPVESPIEAQGPALVTPREIWEMLDQRRQALERREKSLHQTEEWLMALREEIERIVVRYEQSMKAAATTRRGEEQADATAYKARTAQLVKIYESMPPEDAAARIERMPEAKALEILSQLKGKAAGAILASVKPEKAAKLSEQMMSRP